MLCGSKPNILGEGRPEDISASLSLVKFEGWIWSIDIRPFHSVVKCLTFKCSLRKLQTLN